MDFQKLNDFAKKKQKREQRKHYTNLFYSDYIFE